MKEASGELSMTAVAVVAIAAVGVVFTTLVWPTIKNSIQQSTKCTSAYGCNCDDKGNCQCFYMDDKNQEQSITCKRSQMK